MPLKALDAEDVVGTESDGAKEGHTKIIDDPLAMVNGEGGS